MLRNEKILITGPASQVALPVARALAADNEVHGLARFGKEADRERVAALGVTCIALDLAEGSFDAVPDDFTVVLHFAVVKSGDFEYDLAANAEGTGRLMSHCRKARAFLHCSSGGVYAHQGPKHPAKEGDALGDNHAGMLPTYSICKIAAETMARFGARQWNLPTVITRLSVPYGDNGGWPFFHLMMMKAGHPVPLHPERPNVFNPLHEDDYIRQLPRMLEAASVPATVVNWGGDEQVSVEEWCAYLGELTGFEPKFAETDATVGALPVDLTRMHELVGGTEVSWKDGIRRLVQSLAPDLLRTS
jgi:UDP-glucuronate 4-epimerase